MFEWLRDIFFEKEYGVASVTKKGETVKSKAEKYIADYFFDNNINYEYEKPLEEGFWIFKEEISRPDFYLSDYDVYVEFWGLMNNPNYRRTMMLKMKEYKEIKLRYISLYPNNLKNLNYYFKKRLKEVTGKDVKTKYYKWKD